MDLPRKSLPEPAAGIALLTWLASASRSLKVATLGLHKTKHAISWQRAAD
jgi:hypothetical protein